jgi:1-acyl-sn-glycerol-3-phosphate acyltransferase
MLIAVVLLLSILVGAIWCGYSGAFQSFAWLWQLPAGFAGALLSQVVLIFLAVWILSKTIDLNKPQEEDSKFFRWMLGVLVEAAHTILMMRVHTKGLEKTPKDGRFMLVCNHLNDFDPVVLLHAFRRSQLAFISKRENGDRFIVGTLMHRIMCQPINRENDREALKTILNCIRLLKEDKVSIGVFPEGYTSLDHKFHSFRPGVFKIAQKANVPIVVCTLKNTKDVVKNIFKLKPSYTEVNVLEVIPAEEVKSSNTVDIAHRCHDLMAADLGPDLIAE